jgi:small-conductance mechanosensitive channel
MMLEWLAAGDYQPFAFELLERTASTPRVQQVVQLSLAPAFLLGGIGAIMNVMMTRLIWIAGRIERLGESDDVSCSASHAMEIDWLNERRRRMRSAIMFSSASAMIISLVIGLLFISAYITAQIGTLIAGLWILTMVLLVIGLGLFVTETRLSARGYAKRDKRKS